MKKMISPICSVVSMIFLFLTMKFVSFAFLDHAAAADQEVINVRMSEQELLLSYLINNLSRLEDEKLELLNRVRYSKCDSVDCLELIVAIERINMFREFSSHVMYILKLDKKKEVNSD